MGALSTGNLIRKGLAMEDKALSLNRFELLIDWGWFYFITKPMFYSIDWIYHHVGNFGIAILIVTVLGLLPQEKLKVLEFMGQPTLSWPIGAATVAILDGPDVSAA